MAKQTLDEHIKGLEKEKDAKESQIRALKDIVYRQNMAINVFNALISWVTKKIHKLCF